MNQKKGLGMHGKLLSELFSNAALIAPVPAQLSFSGINLSDECYCGIKTISPRIIFLP